MTNTVYDTAVVHACIDCVLINTNDDTTHMTELEVIMWKKGVERLGLAKMGWEWSGVQCDDWDPENDVEHDDEYSRDGWFSWSWCEWCDSKMGGDRYNVAIMKRLH